MRNRKQNWKNVEAPSEVDGHSVAPSHLSQSDSKKGIKCGNPLQVAMGLFVEYCGLSTVHGVRYFTEKKRHWMERVWWILAFALAMSCCGKLIQDVYINWNQSPVIVNFAKKPTSVSEIPFPAVTICPQTKVNMTQLNFTETYLKMSTSIRFTYPNPYNITDDKDELMSALFQICDRHLTQGFGFDQNFTDSSITKLLRDTALGLDDTLTTCKFLNVIDFCHILFDEIMTEEGLCFTFNALNGSELYNKDSISPDYPQSDHNMTANLWNIEGGYDTSIKTDTQTYPYPRRVFGSGAQVSLSVVLRLHEQNFDYFCRGPVQGFKILLHTPGEVPQVSKYYVSVQLQQEVSVLVKPNMITTSEGLRHFEPNRRQCYFASERKLRFLNVYTQRNCELECLTNLTMRACGCVKFSMPRDENTPICGAAKMACYNKAEDDLLKKIFMEELTIEPGAERVKSCNCLPACTSITYDAEIEQHPVVWQTLSEAYYWKQFPGLKKTRLSIYFKENQFVTSIRSELHGLAEVLAHCGGLLNLFMGASFLSIVELLYFFSLRLCCNLRARMQRKRKNRVADSSVPGMVVVKSDDVDKVEHI